MDQKFSQNHRNLLKIFEVLIFNIVSLWLLIALLPAEGLAAQQIFTVSGKVSDSKTGEALITANVRIAGTSKGTITNMDGSYLLSLSPGNYTFIFSYIGYRTDSISVSLSANISRNVAMESADIALPEVVIIAEDPAYAIIRMAIEKKHERAKLLQSYEFKAFTRVTLYRDTSIAGITESYSNGYWRQGDTLTEIVTQKRETQNLPETNMVPSVGKILNFTDDVIDLIVYKFVGPIAEHALDYYKYKLLRTFRKNGVEVYEIQVIPGSRITPLFAGKIMVADSSYAVMGIDLRPNEAFNIPFTSELKLNYGQRYSLYDGRFWMPNDITMDFAAKIGFAVFSIPKIEFNQTSVIYDYWINSQIPDSIFRKRDLVIDSSAAKYDSTFWSTHEVLPLTETEGNAYKTLDSTQTLQKQFQPSGATAFLIDNESSLSALKYIDLRYNRVEGLFLGGSYTYTNKPKMMTVNVYSEGASVSQSSAGLSVSLHAGYGISDEVFKWRFGGTFPFGKDDKVEAGAEVYRDIDHFPDGDFYPTVLTSVISLFGRNDYSDYFMAYGWKAHVSISPFSDFKADITYLSEDEKSDTNHTNFNIFSFGHMYRPNPMIADGQMRSLQLNVRYGGETVTFGIVPVNAVKFSAEYSSPSITGSDFSFNRYYLTASYHIATFLRSYLFPPQLQIRFAGGVSTGKLPPQRDFVLDSQLGRFAEFGVLKTAYPREFVGDRFVMFSAEQNFRNVPFLMLGIPFLYKSGMDVLIDVTAANSWLGGRSTTNGGYYEVGIGIGKIFEFIRVDLTYRLNKPNNLFFSLGISTIL
jgi:hypothetical protein